MVINDIEYCVTLFFEDESGTTLKDMDFSDFSEVNDYIATHKKDCHSVSYTLCEMIDGTPDNFTWKAPFKWGILSDEEIEEIISEQIEFLEEIVEKSEALENWQKEFHYKHENCDFTEKMSQLKDFAYVCPNCFMPIDDCRCRLYPYFLVQIDKLVLPIVRELNIQGYKTTGCCAGHPERDNALRITISFDKDYNFDNSFPEGFRYSKLKHSLFFDAPDGLSVEQLLDLQEEVIDQLADWAEMLLPADNEDELID